MRFFHLAAAWLFALAALAQQNFYLKSGDTVVFYGDSITDQRLYTTFVETYVVTRFPKMQVKFVHSGWGGDRVTGGGGGPIDTRLQRDVLAYKPTVMTIMLGMNDGSYRAYDSGIFEKYASGYENIVRKVKAAAPGVRITVIQPSPYDDVTRPPLFEGGYNQVLQKYGAFLKELSTKEGLNVADLNTPVVEELRSANTLDSTGAAKLIPDRVHPGAGGHLLMAKALLKAWGAPAIVSAVEIDASAAKVTTANGATLERLTSGPPLSWVQTDAALPMPLDMKDAGVALAVRASDVEKALDQELLKITGLRGARYALLIDGEQVGTFTKEQLAEGINLAMLPTPITKQAAEVHALTLKRTNVHNARWRQVQVPLENDSLSNTSGAITGLDRVDEELAQRQRAAAQPKARRFELRPEG